MYNKRVLNFTEGIETNIEKWIKIKSYRQKEKIFCYERPLNK